MVYFRIVDAQSKTLSLSELASDAEAFWENSYLSKRGVCPCYRKPSWEDMIGLAISDAKEANWHSVTLALCTQPIVSSCIEGIFPRLDAFTLNRMRASIEEIQPYLELMQYWAMKGYQPRKD